MMIIRKMEEKDLPEIEAIENSCFGDPWDHEAFQSSLRLPYYTSLAVCEDEKIAGYAVMTTIIDESYIANIAVSGDHRRSGVGSALMEALIEEAKKKNAVCILLEVRVSNEAAIALYEKFHFVRIAGRKNFYDFPREDAWAYRLDLE